MERRELQLIGDVTTRKKQICLILQNVLVQLAFMLLFYFLAPPLTSSAPASVCMPEFMPTGIVCSSVNVSESSMFIGTFENVTVSNQVLLISMTPTPDFTALAEGDTFADTLNYTVDVSVLRPDHKPYFDPSDVVDKLVVNATTYNTSFTCTRNSCSNLTVLRYRIMQPGIYFVSINFSLSDNAYNYLELLKFDNWTMNQMYAILSTLIKSVLFLGTIAISVFYFINIRKLKSRSGFFTFEQKSVVVLDVLLIMFFDPVTIMSSLFPSMFTIIWSYFWNAMFISAFLFFWLVMFRRILTEDYDINTKQIRFYYFVPCAVYFILIFIGGIILTRHNFKNPGSSIINEYPRATVALQWIANSLFLIMFLNFIIGSGLMLAKWNSRPNRHKAFAVSSFSFLVFFLAVSIFSMANPKVRAFTYYELLILPFLVMANYNEIYSFTKQAIQEHHQLQNGVNTGNNGQPSPQERQQAVAMEQIYQSDQAANQQFDDVLFPDKKAKVATADGRELNLNAADEKQPRVVRGSDRKNTGSAAEQKEEEFRWQ